LFGPDGPHTVREGPCRKRGGARTRQDRPRAAGARFSRRRVRDQERACRRFVLGGDIDAEVAWFRGRRFAGSTTATLARSSSFAFFDDVNVRFEFFGYGVFNWAGEWAHQLDRERDRNLQLTHSESAGQLAHPPHPGLLGAARQRVVRHPRLTFFAFGTGSAFFTGFAFRAFCAFRAFFTSSPSSPRRTRCARRAGRPARTFFALELFDDARLDLLDRRDLDRSSCVRSAGHREYHRDRAKHGPRAHPPANSSKHSVHSPRRTSPMVARQRGGHLGGRARHRRTTLAPKCATGTVTPPFIPRR